MALSINFEFATKLFQILACKQFCFLFYLEKFNIIKKVINIKDTLKWYAVLFSCKFNVGSLLLADSFAISFFKFTKYCKNASKNEMYLQEIYQSSNKEMFAISLSSCSRYNETLNWTNHSVRYSWQSAIFLRSVRRTTHGWWPTPAIFDGL
jgi:hypothetical protein